VDIAACKNPLLAAACEIFDFVSQARGGDEVLRDFGFEPVAQKVEGKWHGRPQHFFPRLDKEALAA